MAFAINYAALIAGFESTVKAMKSQNDAVKEFAILSRPK